MSLSFSSLCLFVTFLQWCKSNILDSVRIFFSFVLLRTDFCLLDLTLDIHSSDTFLIRAEKKKTNTIWIHLLKDERPHFCIFAI